ncbi:NUDIX domain-containing protein [Clostridium grantii]|uniref:ADP-ribose pyrophosphatase YjhB, NUDIX family n=1 Tax=Clostridium grantii DSM 8605 TaxID=1121316 RepID=A0A1M5VMH9_9CLOT|nr:NUDIX domain-containing protein [Clostridium grantii]SHH76451.1 ADP-ribose pyrophosphatase YjhB, NUDIX family [Clostridium grantii DSM 8605]
MELITEIYHGTIGIENSKENIKYEIRKAARAVLINENNKIAVLHVAKDNYYKLPGGGVEGNESIYETLSREVYEEVGSDIEVIDEIGIIFEYRDSFEQLQISYNYLCKTKGELIETEFTQSEIDHKFTLKWMSFDEAVKEIESYNGNKYVAKFISLRDLYILKETEKFLK